MPQSCASGQACKLLVALHGCDMSQTDIGETFVQKSGLDEWADTNGLVVLYPQTIPSTSPDNLGSCWDYWGYTNSSYALKSGLQMQSLMAMIDQITGASSSGSSGGSSGSPGSTSGGT